MFVLYGIKTCVEIGTLLLHRTYTTVGCLTSVRSALARCIRVVVVQEESPLSQQCWAHASGVYMVRRDPLFLPYTTVGPFAHCFFVTPCSVFIERVVVRTVAVQFIRLVLLHTVYI